MDRQLTCDERIDEDFGYEMDKVNSALALAEKEIYSNDEGEGIEDLREHIHSLDKKITFYMLLGGGGPEYGFEFDIDVVNKEISGGRYIFKDWGDIAKRELLAEELERVMSAYQIDYDTLMT